MRRGNFPECLPQPVIAQRKREIQILLSDKKTRKVNLPNFVSQVKEAATRRKGRGFDDDRRRNRHEDGYDRIGDSDVAAGGGNEPGPQRSVEGWILFITGIHEEAQEDDIHDKERPY